MTYSDFYDKLAELSLSAPTFQIAELALSLQVALDRVTDCDDDAGLELQSELFSLFDKC